MTDDKTREVADWAGLFDRQCKAVREPRAERTYYGRCERVAGHPGAHALERAMDAPRWSSDWITAVERTAEPPEAEVEAAARATYERRPWRNRVGGPYQWDELLDESRDLWRDAARTALVAARAVEGVEA